MAGSCLGLVIALKCTPALVLAYFGLKRQWRLVFAAAMITVSCTLMPAIRQGASQYRLHMSIWAAHVQRAVQISDPSRGVLGEEPVQNKSLRPALARYLMRLPASHPGRVEHPGYVEFCSLSPIHAGVMIRCAMVMLLLGSAWLFRRPVDSRTSPVVLWEFCAVLTLMLLYSPITWGQHCVAIIPLVYLLAHESIAGEPSLALKGAFVLCAGVPILLLNRVLLGRELSQLAESYHPVTWALLVLFAAAVAVRVRSGRRGL
jgi:hypothetical protein